MSSDPKNDPFRSAVTFDPPEPRDRSFLAPIEERLTKLREHKDVLLSHLQQAYERGPKNEPFDVDKVWSKIETIQFLHSGVELASKEGMGATELKKRYQEIADILKRGRGMIDDSMGSADFANGLINAWWEGTTEFVEAAGRFVDLLYIANEFEKVTNGLVPSNRQHPEPRVTFRRPSGGRGDLCPHTFVRWQTYIEVVLD